jgi:hypothetical protein
LAEGYLPTITARRSIEEVTLAATGLNELIDPLHRKTADRADEL